MFVGDLDLLPAGPGEDADAHVSVFNNPEGRIRGPSSCNVDRNCLISRGWDDGQYEVLSRAVRVGYDPGVLGRGLNLDYKLVEHAEIRTEK